MDLADTGLVDHLGKTFDCGCGRTHTVDLDTVEISAAALDKVAEIIASTVSAGLFYCGCEHT